MRIQFNTAVGMAADNSSFRFSLGGVMVSKEGVACATNGRIAALTFVDIIADSKQDCYIPAECIPKNRAHLRKDVMVEGDTFVRDNPKKSPSMGKFVEGRFPRAMHDTMHVECNDDSHVPVRINAKLLYELAQAINKPGENVVTLLIRRKDLTPYDKEAIPVVSDDTDNVGVIMPVPEPKEFRDPHYRFRTTVMHAKQIDIAADMHNNEVQRRHKEKEKAAATEKATA